MTGVVHCRHVEMVRLLLEYLHAELMRRLTVSALVCFGVLGACNATEPAFQNAYWDNQREGLYVDAVNGEPLFSSRDKFDSGTGWPSFTQPLESGRVVTRSDWSFGTLRTEVRSRGSDAYLGHVFDDGPPPTALTYRVDSASLRFIPVEELAAHGYAEYLPSFAHTVPAGARED
jgi:peptide methionine sulfoxide reductase msrA/msrB